MSMSEPSPLLVQRIARKSDRELIDMHEGRAGELSADTIMLVKLEVERRGGRADLWQRVYPNAPLPVIATPPPPPTPTPAFVATNSNVPRATMSQTIKEECIRDEWAMLVDHGSGQDEWLLSRIHERLQEARIPGGCQWELREVRSSGIFQKESREFLIVTLEKLPDYRNYIGARNFGIHLDCCRLLTIEPGLLKKWASTKLTGDADALSEPKNILIYQDLRAWTTVVHHAVLSSVEELMTKLGQDLSLLHRGSKGFLEIW